MNTEPTIKEQINTAMDILDEKRRCYYQGNATYEDVSMVARSVLELRQKAEKVFMGKVKTRITSQSIASLIRSSY